MTIPIQMPTPLTLARIALILGLNGLTALFAGDALSQGHEAPVPLVDPASLLARPAPQR